MTDARLSIVIPIYNACCTLGRTLSSLKVIAPQNRHLVHVYGVDDGSTDNSVAIFEEYLGEVPDLGYTLLRKKNGGSGSARNLALQSFSVGWVLFLDADDELALDPIPLLEVSRECSALLFDAHYYRDSKVIYTTRVHRPEPRLLGETFSASSPYHPLSLVFRRELVENLFDEELLYVEDWHFLAVNPRIFQQVRLFPGKPLGKVHVGSSNKTAQQYKNGLYRIMAAEKIGVYWGGALGAKGKNNIKIQQHIGLLQTGEKRQLSALLLLPASVTLYLKLIIYAFFFKLYLKLYPYA